MNTKRTQHFIAIFSIIIFLSIFFAPVRVIIFGEIPKVAFSLPKEAPHPPTPPFDPTPIVTLTSIPPTPILESTKISPTPIATPVPTELPPTNVELLQGEIYAKQFSVSVDEAIKRIRLQKDIGNLNAVLIKDHSDIFAGMWIEHEPAFRVVIALTSNDLNSVNSLILDSPLSDIVETAEAIFPLTALKFKQQETISTLRNSGIMVESGIDIQSNQVKIYVLDDDKLIVDKLNIPGGVKVEIVENNVSRPEVDIYGGLDIGPCFSGFSTLHNNGNLYITTSGHCNPVTLSYLSTNLPYISWTDSGSADVARISPVSFMPRNQFNIGTSNPALIDEVKHLHDSQTVGEQVCKFKPSVGSLLCGFITTVNFLPLVPGITYNPTFIRVSAGSTNLSDPGESGSTWTSGNTAYGIHGGSVGSAPNEAYYMPQNYVDVLGLCVLRGPFGNPAPITTGLLSGASLRLDWTHMDVCGYEIHRSQNPYLVV